MIHVISCELEVDDLQLVVILCDFFSFFSDRGRASAVRLGTIDATKIDEHTHIVSIIETFLHPDFSSSSKYNDIALFKMSHKVYFTEFVRPACLPYEPNEWGQAVATGFGKTAYSMNEFWASFFLQPIFETILFLMTPFI